MPNQVTSRIILDGIRRATVQFTGIGDGSGNQEANVKKVDVSLLNPVGSVHMKVRAIKYDVYGGVVVLSWDAPAPLPFLTLSNAADHVDYSGFGGIHSDQVPGATGSILLSTIGFDIGSTYTITIDLVKAN